MTEMGIGTIKNILEDKLGKKVVLGYPAELSGDTVALRYRDLALNVSTPNQYDLFPDIELEFAVDDPLTLVDTVKLFVQTIENEIHDSTEESRGSFKFMSSSLSTTGTKSNVILVMTHNVVIQVD